MACRWLTGTQPSESDVLHMSVMNGSNSVRNSFTTCDGIGSRAQVFDGAPEITFLISSMVYGETLEGLLVQEVAQTLEEHRLSRDELHLPFR